MKRKIIASLFGTSFAASFFGEIYLLNAEKPHWFSVIGIGIVVILTGYLFFDTIGEYILKELNSREMLREKEAQMYAEKLDEMCSELNNIQKATYAAIKKSDSRLQEEMNRLSEKLSQVIETQNKILAWQAKTLKESAGKKRIP